MPGIAGGRSKKIASSERTEVLRSSLFRKCRLNGSESTVNVKSQLGTAAAAAGTAPSDLAGSVKNGVRKCSSDVSLGCRGSAWYARSRGSNTVPLFEIKISKAGESSGRELFFSFKIHFAARRRRSTTAVWILATRSHRNVLVLILVVVS